MMEPKIRVPYISVWDGGTEIRTSASLNIRTGRIYDIVSVDPSNALQVCEREYITLNDEQFDVLSEEDEYWVQLYSDHVVPITDSFIEHKDAMQELSITQIIKVVDYVVALSQYINDDNEILDDMDSILEPLYAVIKELRTDEICRHSNCGSFLYKSDLPQYDYVCPECDENF